MNKEPEFLRQVRDALAHLYDYAYLQRHTLAARLVPVQASTMRTRGQELRRILLDAIEALNPGDNVPIRSLERRPYAILFALYVEGRPQAEVASWLGIGTRQLRRDRAAAIEALASLLCDRYLPLASPEASSAAPEPLRLESERLALQRQPVNLHDLVQGLLPLLEGMAHERGVPLSSHVHPGLPEPNTNRTLLRQVLISLASQALTLLPLAQLSFEARSEGVVVGIGLYLEYQQEGPPARLVAPSVETLVASLGASLLSESAGSREEKVWVLLPLQEETTVLVVDDNQELFALFQRYVAGQPYRLIHAGGADEALALARAHNPGIITLDLMMPSRDGWELLQILHADPVTAHTPVIICSVLDEPELALSLGAGLYLKKPVTQADLLQALEEAKMRAWAGGGHRGAPARNSAPPSG